MIEKEEIQASIRSLADSLRERKINPKMIFTEIHSGRKPSVKASSLIEIMQSYYPEITSTKSIEDPYEAFEESLKIANHGHGNLLVIGSIYLIGEIVSKIISNRGLDANEVMTIH
jgi:folylpolyglutamate synthase/dihydropteroate synthase